MAKLSKKSRLYAINQHLQYSLGMLLHLTKKADELIPAETGEAKETYIAIMNALQDKLRMLQTLTDYEEK